MDKTIIFSQLSHTVASLTQTTDADAETFLRELFALAAERLAEEGEVAVPQLGRFVITSETVAFVADPALAEAINAPFSAFEPVELPDDEEPESVEPEESAEPEERHAPEAPEEETPEPEIAAEQIAEAAEFEEASDAVEQESAAEPQETEPTPRRRRDGAWLLWLLACALCFAGGWLLGSYSRQAPACRAVELNEPAGFVEPADSVVEAEPADSVAEPEPEVVKVVTDTIGPSRFLTTMARAHYGQMDYWVYIYEENADRLGHPDRLEAGTVVVIPPADKYGLIAGDEEKLKEANRKAIEIYGRFN